MFLSRFSKKAMELLYASRQPNLKSRCWEFATSSAHFDGAAINTIEEDKVDATQVIRHDRNLFDEMSERETRRIHTRKQNDAGIIPNPELDACLVCIQLSFNVLFDAYCRLSRIAGGGRWLSQIVEKGYNVEPVLELESLFQLQILEVLSLELNSWTGKLNDRIEVDVNFSCVTDETTALHCAISSRSLRAVDVVGLFLNTCVDHYMTDAHGLRPFVVIFAPRGFSDLKSSLEEISKDSGYGFALPTPYMTFSPAVCKSNQYEAEKGDWVSVDCGYSGESYLDDNLIFGSGDDGFFKKSESIAIPTNSVSEPMRTLTVFTPEYKKNCYCILQDKGQKVLVRASFYYGNYDKKSSPPTFDLQFEGNHWEKVVTSIDQVVTYEAIYVTKTNSVNVCLAQLLPNQFAFISALEVVPLEMSMYNYVNSDTALFLKARVPCGSKETIRYSTDSYDRIWTPVTGGDGLLDTTYAGIFIDTSTLADVAPPEVLLDAFTTSDTSTPIELGSFFPPDPTSLHINMYFSEVTELEPTQTRSFKLFINNEEKSDPIVPVYGEAVEESYTNFTASSSTSFSLVATETSTLPPLLNAFEIFTISDTLSDGTYSADVDGVFALMLEVLCEFEDEFFPTWRG